MKTIITVIAIAILFTATTVSAAGFYKVKYLSETNASVFQGQALSDAGTTLTRIDDDNGVTCYVATAKNTNGLVFNTSVSCIKTSTSTISK